VTAVTCRLERGCVIVTGCTVGLIGALMVGISLTCGLVIAMIGCFGVTDLADRCRGGMSSGIGTEGGHVVEDDRQRIALARRPVNKTGWRCHDRLLDPLYVVGRLVVTGSTGELTVLAARNTPCTVLGTKVVTVVDQRITRGSKSRTGHDDHHDDRQQQLKAPSRLLVFHTCLLRP